MSGSAFKLVNKRAYHHGTMLIDAKLGDLRGVLGSQRVRYAVVLYDIRMLTVWTMSRNRW